jgi:hypothetical protein
MSKAAMKMNRESRLLRPFVSIEGALRGQETAMNLSIVKATVKKVDPEKADDEKEMCWSLGNEKYIWIQLKEQLPTSQMG